MDLYVREYDLFYGRMSKESVLYVQGLEARVGDIAWSRVDRWWLGGGGGERGVWLRTGRRAGSAGLAIAGESSPRHQLLGTPAEIANLLRNSKGSQLDLQAPECSRAHCSSFTLHSCACAGHCDTATCAAGPSRLRGAITDLIGSMRNCVV
ncbi:hypothetical protein O0L34_g1371 [Tuta absoluta]|nr:hypothetical protein O0L34_g1371 [Tuta absoluta]